MIKLALSELENHYNYVLNEKKRVVSAYNKLCRDERMDTVTIDHYVLPVSHYNNNPTDYFCIRNENTLLAVYRKNGILRNVQCWPKSVEEGTAMTYWSFVKQQNDNNPATSDPLDDITEHQLIAMLDEFECE